MLARYSAATAARTLRSIAGLVEIEGLHVSQPVPAVCLGQRGAKIGSVLVLVVVVPAA